MVYFAQPLLLLGIQKLDDWAFHMESSHASFVHGIMLTALLEYMFSCSQHLHAPLSMLYTVARVLFSFMAPIRVATLKKSSSGTHSLITKQIVPPLYHQSLTWPLLQMLF